jgi:hypothetical protein
MRYAEMDNWLFRQNKPNSNPIKPNSRKAKINAKHICTESYDDKTILWLCENKANSNPICSELVEPIKACPANPERITSVGLVISL